MDDREGMKGDERLTARIEHGTVDIDTADWVRTVEHDEPDAMFRGGFHRVAHGRNIRIEASSNVLNVKNQRIDAREHLAGRPPSLAVKAVDGDSGIRITAVGNAGHVEFARGVRAPG